MSRRTLLFCAIAIGAACLFIRLGVWQIERLHERQAVNATIGAQLSSTPQTFAAVSHEHADVHYRPATLTGRFDYEHELVLAGRTRQGSPGVELLTPVRLLASDTAVLVNRGWVYSPDASTVDRTRWREGDSARITGYVELYAPDAPMGVSTSDARVVRRVSRREIASKIPYPVAPFYLVATGGGDTVGLPGRRQRPALDDGPHRSYAFQWFAFASIALVGAVAVVVRERRERAAGSLLDRR